MKLKRKMTKVWVLSYKKMHWTAYIESLIIIILLVALIQPWATSYAVLIYVIGFAHHLYKREYS